MRSHCCNGSSAQSSICSGELRRGSGCGIEARQLGHCRQSGLLPEQPLPQSEPSGSPAGLRGAQILPAASALPGCRRGGGLQVQ
jgi:hypothetical protein